ncbi:hypothetical protein [Halalkalirubrum salinum]|uniref:hypothetical protein n=1 Tax=Halalkalirubrum salinum TaxID=2563889 RepID=UPI0010FB7167|nr:hypothetical protein [Halalkalirubrum salinum]
MPRDIAPLTSALEDTTPGEQSDVYSLLAAWNQSIETALDRGGWSRLQEIRGQYLEEVIDFVDTAATTDGIDWAFLEECADAYPPGVGDHHCSSILANVVARCVIRTRIREGVDAIPTWALEYLADVTVEDDSEWAWESTAAFGWAVGHPEIAVLDRTLERAESGDESWAMGILEHATFADPEAGIDLLERLLDSPDVVEDLLFVSCLHAPFEQNFPDFPQYWVPDTELDYHVEVSDDLHERLLAIIGQSIDPGRLRHFDGSYRFDLERAADEYGPGNDA